MGPIFYVFLFLVNRKNYSDFFFIDQQFWSFGNRFGSANSGPTSNKKLSAYIPPTEDTFFLTSGGPSAWKNTSKVGGVCA